jgi:hypothetical protein
MMNGGEEYVRLYERRDNDVLADYGYLEITYRHRGFLLLAREVHDPAER